MAWRMIVLNGSFAVTRTVNDTTSQDSSSNSIRVAVDGSGNARLIAYSKVEGPSRGPNIDLHQFPVAHMYSCTTAASTFTYLGAVPYVKENSVPWYNSTTGRWYVNLVSFRGGTGNIDTDKNRAGVSSFVLDITESTITTTPYRFRPACVIGEYTPDSSYVHSSDRIGYFRNGEIQAQRPASDGYNTYIGQGQIKSYGLRGYSVCKLGLYDRKSTNASSGCISGGTTQKFDGYQPYDLGMLLQPGLHVVNETTGNSIMEDGSFNYVAVATYLDKESNTVYSRCSEVVNVTTTGGFGSVKADVSIPNVSQFSGPVTISLFRTLTGQTQFYLLESRNTSITALGLGLAGDVLESFGDDLDDDTLATKPLLHRQPGTQGTALDRTNPLASSTVIRHKDRYFYAHDSTLYFSSFDVDGEAPWFSPGFIIDGFQYGTGPITGLASMDGSLVVFKKDAVFIVDGDGPPENGGTGNEFSTPRKVHTQYGCTDPRSVVEIPDGIVFRSLRGIELLTRSYKTQFFGERIQNTVNSYKYVGGATYDKVQARLYMALSNTLTADGGHDHTAAGVTIVYDTVSNAWTKFYHYNSSGYGKSMQDVLFTHTKPTGNTNEDCVWFADHSSGTFWERDASGLDYSAGDIHVPWKIETGWVRAMSKQDRIRVTDFYLLGRRLSGHNIKCQYLTDYIRSSAATIKTFDATATNIIPLQLEFQPAKESVQSMKFILSSESPTNPTTLGTGQQLEINGITVRVGLKGGGPKLAASQKG